MVHDVFSRRVSRRGFLAGLAGTAAAGVGSLGAGHVLPRVFAAAQGQRGGTLRATLGGEPDTLDPHVGNSLFDEDVAGALFDCLTRTDSAGLLQSALAESWRSADALAWTFRLRPNARFHDGSPVTADAVRATVERLADKATGASGAYTVVTNQIASLETPDSLTVIFHLTAPNAVFPLGMSRIAIVPRSFSVARPVGAGPFQFVEWVRNRYVRVRRFDGYYRQGLPYLDQIDFMPTPDENQKIVLLQTGQVDFTDTVPLPRAQEVEKSGKIQVFTITPGVAPSAYVMFANTRVAPLNNLKVRQAINYAIDRRAMLDANFGFGVTKSNPVPPRNWAFDPTAASYNVRDVAKAKQLLREAGAAAGFSIELVHITSRAEFATLAQLFQANMADVGIKVAITPIQIGVWVDREVKHQYQLGLTGIVPPVADPDLILSAYDSDGATGESTGWQDAEYHRLLAQARAVLDQTQRKALYARCQQILQEACPVFVINERPILCGGSSAVQGFRVNVGQITEFQDVWMKP